MSFRDAYKAVAEQLENGTFQSPKETKRTYEGSINNLCLDAIKKKTNDSINFFYLFIKKIKPQIR
jgi:argininosuccinate lyase